MDFGDFITLILFLAFVVSPFLKRKKAQKPDSSQPGRGSVLGKLKKALQEAVREMEARADQARKKETPGLNGHPGQESANQTFWDEIDDRDDEDFYPDDGDAQTLEQIETVHDPVVFVPTEKEDHTTIFQRSETQKPELAPLDHDAIQASCPESGQRPLPVRARGLQKAVVWSEILGKPVALRD